MSGFKYDDEEWQDGKIYDSESGNTYSAFIKLAKHNRNLMKLRGYVGISLFGRTSEWTRKLDEPHEK